MVQSKTILLIVVVIGLLAASFYAGTHWQQLQGELFATGDDTHDDHADDNPAVTAHSSTALPIDDSQADSEDHADHIDLSIEACRNLQLREGKVELRDYWRRLRVPAEVIEKPGESNHALAAPVNSIVSRVFVIPGQAVSAGDLLFDLQVTDDILAQSQLDLLSTVTRLDVVDTELKRLEPLVSSGTVPGKRTLELEYERQELEAKLNLNKQALLVRGLNEEQVEKILATRELVRHITVPLPKYPHRHGPSEPPHEDKLDYTIETLIALPGTTVKRGDDLCELAYHARLYVKGRAFENELDWVSGALAQGAQVTADFGLEHQKYSREGLKIEFIDNHVDDKSQTFSFFVPLANEIVRDYEEGGARFRNWRFKPGQRAHIWVPVEHWESQIVLPAAATVREGPDVFVFRKGPHSLAGEANLIEYERVPVTLIYQDLQEVVIERDGQLKEGDVIALNGAYELNLALRMASQGGGHAHDHDH